MLWRAFRKRRELKNCIDRTQQIKARDVLLFSTVRNEMLRLPYFLEHYRRLGVGHFLFVDNGSDDGTRAFLSSQPDVSLWETVHSYKASRFGMDWLTWLQRRHAHGHWTLTVDADELLIYPNHETHSLQDLTAWLDATRQTKVGAIMLDLYPRGSIASQHYRPNSDPTQVLNWFDAYGYWAQIQVKMGNLWLQGGPRARCFFQEDVRRAPTLNKIPLVKWRRSYVYVNSTHNALPPRMNRTYDENGQEKLNVVLLHTKFLPDAADRAQVEKTRSEHFSNGALFSDYYDAVAEAPDLWCDASVRYQGWQQLLDLRLMSRGGWPPQDARNSLRSRAK